MTEETPLKPVVWMGSSRKDLTRFPDSVQHQVGYAIYEVVEDFYTLKYSNTVYVLHAFRKKPKSGRETPRRDMELIEQRLREAERIAKGRKS
jgi:phage-related protein